VKADEMTDAVQVVAPPRSSMTVTGPSGPDIVLPVGRATWVPSDTALVGALIDSPPDVRVKLAGVIAPAGAATHSVPAARRTAIPANRTKFLMSHASP